MRWRRLVTIGLGTPAVLLLLTAVALFLARGVVLRGLFKYIERKVNASGSVRLEMENVTGDPLSGVVLSGVRLTAGRGGEGARPFLEADTVAVHYAMGDVFGARRVRSVRVVRPRLAADALPKRSALSGGPGRLAISALPAAGIDSLIVEDGAVSGLRVPLSEISLDAEIRSEAGKARALLRRAVAVLADSVPLAAEGRVSIAPESVAIDDARLVVAGSRALVGGTVHLGKPLSLDLAVSLDSLHVADVARLVPSLPREGTAAGRLAVRGSPGDLRVTGDLTARYLAHELDADLVQISINTAEVSVDSLWGRIAGAEVAGSWRLPRGGGAAHRGVLRFRRVNLNAFAPEGSKVPVSDMTGVLTWDGAGWSPATLDGDLTLSLGPGRIGEIPFDAVATKGRVAEKRLLLERIDASFLGGTIEGAGEVGFAGHIDLAATSKFEDLSRVARMLGLEGAGGRGTFTGQIVRDDSLLSIDGVLDGETWQVNGLRLNQVDATGTLESRDGALTVIASGEVGGIEGYGKTLGGVRAAVRYEREHLLLEELVGRIAGVDFTAQGEWIREAEVDRFVISSLAVTRNGEVKTYRDAIEVRKRGSLFTLVPTSFPFRGGLLSMRGEYDLAGPIEVEASWEGLHLSDLRLPAAVPRRLFESVSGNLSISGTRQRPNVRIDLSGSPAAADSAPKDGFAALRLDVEYAAGRPLGVALRLADAGGRARLAIDGTLADSLPSSIPRPAGGVREAIRLLARPDLTVQADSLPIEWLRGLSRSLNDFGGPLFATWRFTGPIDSLGASGAFTVSPLRYKSRDVAPLAGDISLGGAGLVLDITFPPEWGASRIHATLPARLDATKPMFAFDGSKPFSLDARVEKGDLSLFTLFIKEAREAHGEFALAFAGSGTLEKPSLSGTLTISKGTLIIRDLVELYEDVTGEIRIENNLFTITSLRAKEGEKGTVEASGTFRLVRWKADELDFKLRLRNFNVESIPETGATINADIDVKTREADFGWRCPHLTGSIDILGAVVEQNFRSSGEKPPTPAIFRATTTPDWTARIRIRAPEDIWIDNDDMEVELRGDGDLILGRSNRGLGLIGRLEVVGGRYRLYYSWIANELDVEEGEIVWRNPDDAQQFWISAMASTEASGERVEITVQGPPDSLIVHASSDGNLSESEILGSLAIGQSTREGETGNTSRSLVGAWGTVFAQLLTRELTRGLRGFVGFDIVTPEGVPQFVVSKDIARHVDVAVQQDIATLPGSQPTETTAAERAYLPERQFRIRYRMTRAFYLEALTGSLQDGSQVYNLDLKWRLSY